MKAFFKWLFANKRSVSSTIANAVTSFTSAVSAMTVEGLPAVMVGTFNAAPVLVCVIFAAVFVLVEIGITGRGFEDVITFLAKQKVHDTAAANKAAQKAQDKALAAAMKAQKAAEAAADEQAKVAAKIAEMQ